MDTHRVQLWARMDPFLIGVLQFPPPAKFNLHYLRKMATYVRTRTVDGCFPRLYWTMWRHIACGKLQLQEDMAWLYFEVFHSLSERTAIKSLEWAEAASSCKSVEEYERVRSKLSVDTLTFLLFLYIQQINKVSLRTSLIGEEWPSPRARSSSPDLAGQSNFHKNWDDYSQHAFIQSHMPYLLELLLDPDQLTKSYHSSECSLLSIGAAKALGFLIEGTMDKNRTVHLFPDLATWQPLHSKSGYSKTTESFSLSKLQAWIKDSLMVNPFGMSACVRSGKTLAWAEQIDGSSRRAKIACNIYKVPPGNPMVVMSHICRQTLAKSSETLVNARVKIVNCNESYIYLLSPLRCVTIEKCRNSTFVLGPVQTVVHVQMCDHVTIISVCQRLSLSSTTSCTFHILTPTRPLLFNGNQGVIFAPYHTYYAMLEDHMGQTGLATLPNYWDRPQFFSAESDSQVWKLMSPREFYTFSVPFEMEGDTTEIPGGLPPAFLKAMDQRQQKIQMWQKTVKEAKLNREQKKRFQALVEYKFNEWLVKTGNRYQLDSLVPATDGTKQAAG
ncbi:TBCC domain-containing protein 1 isoform X1 [Rana temporaria]|uniref:TBCC domain-containing protein 1 isoform X1 n=1 Tax=Rana temporaria TaxID=8407 RepID=UPI001AAC64A0|nr:TBCC domain-containing protein 1 isoform X1 [Rana temporaria]